MRRSLLCAACCLGLSLGGCDESPPDDAEETEPEPEPEQTAEGDNDSPAPPVARTPVDGATHFDLLALSHLADVDHRGLFIDFGTQARFKYTSGNWNSGWGSDHMVGGEPMTRFGRMGRVYFNLDRPKALRLRLRVKNVASDVLLPFLNGHALGEVSVESGAARTLTIEVPEEHVRSGENYLLLRSTETREIDDEPVSFDVAWLQVLDAEGDVPELPRPLRARPRVGGDTRDALVLPAPTTLSWTLEIPDDANLVLATGLADDKAGSIRIMATPAGGEPVQLHEGSLTASWQQLNLPLNRVAQKIVRLEIQARGEAKVAIADPRIVVPQPNLAALGSSAAPHAKNVIVLTIDTLRADKLRIYNRQSRVRTPALDAFAREATIFENAQSPENWTKPSVASILTSLFPATHGTKNDASSLPDTVLTLGEIYQQHGFKTASFLANGYVSNAFGFNQGWDHYTNYIRERRNTNASNVFGEAYDWIENHVEDNEDKRFFVYIQTIDPHVPYDPPDEFLQMYDARDYQGQVQNRRTHLLLEDAKRRPPRVTFSESDVTRLQALHDGEISYHDRHFGRFIEKLSELGLMENTIFVITSDHGEEFNEHGSWGHGHSVFQELLHVPLMVRYRGVSRPGHRVPEVVSTMGIAPTVLEATGHDIPEVFEGNSLMGFIRGASPPGPYVAFSDFQENRRVIRGRDWKLILRSSLTYVLFDLERDPAETQENDVRRHPIAMRYLRTLSGQFLGAQNRAHWLTGGGGAVSHDSAQNMTLELCEQLVALGYFECLGQFPDAM